MTEAKYLYIRNVLVRSKCLQANQIYKAKRYSRSADVLRWQQRQFVQQNILETVQEFCKTIFYGFEIHYTYEGYTRIDYVEITKTRGSVPDRITLDDED